MPYCLNRKCEHFLQTGKAAEYEEGVVNCSECGAKLSKNFPQPEDLDTSYEEWVNLFSFARRHNADLIKDALENEKIPFITKGDEQQMPWGMTQSLAEIQIMVPKKYEEQATQLVHELLKENPYECPECGLAIPEDYDKCPACGTEFEK